MMKFVKWMVAAVLGLGLYASAQCTRQAGEPFLQFDERNPQADIVYENQVGNNPCKKFFTQGHRMELRVVHRRFLTDYSISIDAVTELQTGPNIRNLNEAENLSLGPASFASFPPSKGGVEGLTPRSASQILLELADETTATKPQTDLEADHDVIERERAKIQAQLADFKKHYELIRGNQDESPEFVNCSAVLGAPNILHLELCLNRELAKEYSDPWAGPGPYTDEPAEQEFRSVNTRVQDLIAAVKTLGTQLANTDLPSKLKNLETAIAQFQNDLNTFRGNVEAAHDGARLARGLNETFRKNLRRQEMRALLLDKLKGPDSKPVLDEAEMNHLLDLYTYSNPIGAPALPSSRWGNLEALARNYRASLPTADEFVADLERARTRMNVELAGAISDLNATQGTLLNRVNYIYDHSEVIHPLPKQIDLSGHSGNLIVYYTIRRIETFQRYTMTQVQGPGSSSQANLVGTPLPPAKGATGAESKPATPNAGTDAGNNSANPAQTGAGGSPPPTTDQNAQANTGMVVAKGSFEVHDVFHANVVAAVVFSTIKDQSITKQAQPQSCTGTATTPDANCFSPLPNGSSYKWAPIVGLDYYFQPRDSFPRRPGMRWECRDTPWQCFGIMGAASAIKANSYFLGGFFEPKLGVQISAGANFGVRSVLDRNYKIDTPVDIMGDFPTHDERATGFYFGVGLDLGIFRKVFGKVTGIGTGASGTSGK